MPDSTNTNIVQRGIRVLKQDGVSGFIWRLMEKAGLNPSQTHTHVLKWSKELLPTEQKSLINLEMTQVGPDDDALIDEITQIDEWKISKSVSIKDLHDGQCCYVAIHQGKIVASGWVIVGDKFTDSHLKSEFYLADDEAYFWRGYTVRKYRGKGVIIDLTVHALLDLVEHYGKKTIYTLVRTNNRAIIRTMARVGFNQVGRSGFIEAGGIRLHYLWGYGAFSATRKRIYLSRS